MKELYKLVCKSCGEQMGWSEFTNQRHICFKCAGKTLVKLINKMHKGGNNENSENKIKDA